MARARLHSSDGKFREEIDLPDAMFGQEIDRGLIHLALTILAGNRRQGTSRTKTRSQVSGGGDKPWKQKGTGRARAGSNTSPIWSRGGKAHGAKARNYTRGLPKNARRKALVSALSLKAGASCVHVFEDLQLEAPKTRQMASILKNAELLGTRNLLLVPQADERVLLASRNIPDVRVGRVGDLNTLQVMSAQRLLFTRGALNALVKPEQAA